MKACADSHHVGVSDGVHHFCPSGRQPRPVLDRIQKAGELVVGMSGTSRHSTPLPRDGKVIGLEVDIAARMAAAMEVGSGWRPCLRPTVASAVGGEIDSDPVGMIDVAGP